ncbi:MAG: Hsp20 family protein [Pseudomonadales bacterium]|nr:Hsp20/alpha crystallin family protein [Pseudomonadales bacterium]NIX08333.1 Hsp20 family protein [Pseudomonadales bacterium]
MSESQISVKETEPDKTPETAETGEEAGGLATARRERDIERLFEDFFDKRWLRPWSREWPGFESILDKKGPKVDVVDREHEIFVRAELPGMSKEDIEVSVGDDSLSVKGSSRKEEETEEGDYHRREISTSYVARTVPLPARVRGNEAKATLRDGMLEVTIPKAEDSKRRRIEVES